MREKTFYLQDGTIYGPSGNPIENPAMLIDYRADVLLGCGDITTMQAKFDRYLAAGPILADTIMLIQFNGLTADKTLICYAMKRATEYTASGFCKQLREHEADMADWLASEMRRIPLDLS